MTCTENVDTFFVTILTILENFRFFVTILTNFDNFGQFLENFNNFDIFDFFDVEKLQFFKHSFDNFYHLDNRKDKPGDL